MRLQFINFLLRALTQRSDGDLRCSSTRYIQDSATPGHYWNQIKNVWSSQMKFICFRYDVVWLRDLKDSDGTRILPYLNHKITDANPGLL